MALGYELAWLRDLGYPHRYYIAPAAVGAPAEVAEGRTEPVSASVPASTADSRRPASPERRPTRTTPRPQGDDTLLAGLGGGAAVCQTGRRAGWRAQCVDAAGSPKA